LHFRSWMTMSVLSTCLCVGLIASAQSLPTDQTENARPAQYNDIDRQELASFDRFMMTTAKSRIAFAKIPRSSITGNSLPTIPISKPISAIIRASAR